VETKVMTAVRIAHETGRYNDGIRKFLLERDYCTSCGYAFGRDEEFQPLTDPRTGETVHALCDPCAAPITKCMDSLRARKYDTASNKETA
jgi:hypothetical protein